MKINTDSEKDIIPENTIDNKLEILRFASQVQSRIKNDISEDFILAKLGEQDKEGIIEMTSNAYFMKKILIILSKKGRKWKWDDEHKQWRKRLLSKEEKELIQEVANATFDSYLTRIYMTVILNRNVPSNYILKILAGSPNPDEDEVELKQFKDKIGDIIAPEPQQVKP